MATSDSRLVLDWLRTWSVGKLDAIGRTDITSNMNVPLTSDVRVNAAIGYMTGVRDDAYAVVITVPHDQWEAWQDGAWYDIKRSMPSDVRAVWDQLFADSDLNVRTLLKLTIEATVMLTFVDMAGV